MKNANYKLALYIFISVFLTFGLTVSLQSILADWTAPTGAPPADNIAPPIFSNSTISQTITGGGGLAITGPIAATRAAFPGWISGDGDDEGIYISSEGNIGIGTNDFSLNSGLSRMILKAAAPGPAFYLLNEENNPEIALGTLSDYWSIYAVKTGTNIGDLRFWKGGNNQFIITADGRIGIGGVDNPTTQLEVKGGIKIGNELVCDINNEGTIRYNSLIKSMEFCNGTTWRWMEHLDDCTDNCSELECGSNNCGVDCGKSCNIGETCINNKCVVCTCVGKVCGTDGCGNVCPPDSCDPATEKCVNGQCIFNAPDGCSLPLYGSATWDEGKYTYSTGNAECAEKGYSVCQQAYDAIGHAIACSETEHEGNALCKNPTCSGCKWDEGISTYSTGNAECAERGRTCQQAYDASGHAIACSETEHEGSVLCSVQTGYGVHWDEGKYTYSTGNAECAERGHACQQAYDASGHAIACSETEHEGSALCGNPSCQGVHWDEGSYGYSTGNAECATIGRLCSQAFNSSGTETSCSTTLHEGSAFCCSS